LQHPTTLAQEPSGDVRELEVIEEMLRENELRGVVGKWQGSTKVHSDVCAPGSIDVDPARHPVGSARDVEPETATAAEPSNPRSLRGRQTRGEIASGCVQLVPDEPTDPKQIGTIVHEPRSQSVPNTEHGLSISLDALADILDQPLAGHVREPSL
jgi:hypothetical protein